MTVGEIGEIVAIGDGPLEVELLPAIGARLHRLRFQGRDLLRTPVDPARHRIDPVFWGGFVMAPWCNRLEAAPTRAGDRIVDLPATFRDGTAIHGQVLDRPWEVAGPGRFRVIGGGDGWPWRYEVGLDVVVAGATLELEQTLTNLDDAPMPAGIGLHPWFIQPVEVGIPADSVYPTNVGAGAHPEPVAGPWDLRRTGPLAAGLDATWSQLDGPVELAWPGSGLRAQMTVRRADGGAICIVAANLGEGAIAIEPETHAPHGLRRLLDGQPDGMRWLDPGECLRLTTVLTFGTPAAGNR
jgi:aldose 1-epimerase